MDAPEDMEKVMERIQKLLSLASKNPSSEEAAAATAKAQELLTRYYVATATSHGSARKADLRAK